MAAGSILVSDAVEERRSSALEAAARGVPRCILRPSGPSSDPSMVEIAFFSGDLFPERTRDFVLALAKSERLRWLHTFSAGVDHPWFRNLRERGVRITTSSGAAAVPIAQTVILYLLALSRNLPAWLDAQRRHAWEPHDVQDLQGLLLGVIGLGPIGLEVARLGAALRMRVLALRRTPRGDEPCETWPLSRLHELLSRADAVVLALPLTGATRHILSVQAIAAMKPGAVLVNVGRGELVEESALVAALAKGALRGAGLDVFEKEPLPPESSLWSLPGVIVTPHASGRTPGNYARAEVLFLENLGRFSRGEALLNEAE
ncbi:MAG TPA: D-2-hydroxyacid dehydrogenase [Myxococcota bacterium]|nr:D-2-hydroxyacid dehydrogenase [Myxococcota bacterium]